MSSQTKFDAYTTLLIMMASFCAASLLHFVHNATHLHEYPNLPASLTSFGVYAAWFGMTAVGVVGYFVFRRGAEVIGLWIIAVYALLGFAGLDHYAIAPIAAHSVMMNATIVIEVAAAAMLLLFAVRSILSLRQAIDQTIYKTT